MLFIPYNYAQASCLICFSVQKLVQCCTNIPAYPLWYQVILIAITCLIHSRILYNSLQRAKSWPHFTMLPVTTSVLTY